MGIRRLHTMHKIGIIGARMIGALQQSPDAPGRGGPRRVVFVPSHDCRRFVSLLAYSTGDTWTSSHESPASPRRGVLPVLGGAARPRKVLLVPENLAAAAGGAAPP